VINETSLRCFLTLCRTLNFTEAAKRMYMTQQSVSKYIAKLEEDIGFTLFVRTHHSVALTRAGEEFCGSQNSIRTTPTPSTECGSITRS
jgi:DNA-binding transcriptional LysR family regulator